MGEVIVALGVLGYSFDYKNSKQSKEELEKEMGKIKTREDAEKFFQSLGGEVRLIKEKEKLVEENDGKYLYNLRYHDATSNYSFTDF
jgi:hypothetical protein